MNKMSNALPATLLAAALTLAFRATSTYGLVVQNATSTDSSTVFGYANVGTVNNASCVYLGDGWVITASHVAPSAGGTLTLSTGGYTVDSTYGVTNTDGSAADLTLVHLTTLPTGLSSLTVASSSPTSAQPITMVGYGFTAGARVYYTVSGTSDNPVFTSQTTPIGADEAGYAYATQNKSFGTNIVGTDPDPNAPAGTVLFTSNGSTGFFVPFYGNTLDGETNLFEESIATNGDSGGGVFSNGELIGIIDEKYTYTNQPDSTALYGTGSFVIDLASYTSQIQTITGIDFTAAAVPEPASLGLLLAAPVLMLRRRRVR